jgi:regulator of cell morphogenesis and NO signaling
MNEFKSKSLSQIANEQHQTAAVFEKYNLDYCCNGKRSLQQACSENYISLNEVVAELQNICENKTKELDFNNVKLFQLADYIVYTHHSYVKKEMPRMLSYLEKVSFKHGSRHNELYKISELFVDLYNEMTYHVHHEETILFPRIKQLEQNGFEPIPFDIKHYQYLELPIIDMKDDDEDAGDKMAEIRKLTNNYTPPADSCTTFKLLYASLQAFEIDLHYYIHLENSILFPKALDLEKETKYKVLN